MNIGSRLETKMDALRQSARDRFREESFAKGPPQYDIVTISSDKETTSPLTTDGATIDRIERLSKAMQPTSLLLVKILFDLPLDRHIFHTSESHFLRLLNAFEIDSYWLDMIANDMTGFHHLGRNSETSSYYLQCAAYKFIWASNSKHKCTKAIALINNTRKSRDALDECIPIMHANIKFLSHPLFLLVSGAIQTVRFMDGMLREQYVQCKTSEAATGFRTLPVGVVTRENVLELSGMAQRVGTLLIKIEMIIRRVKQWQLAMDTFKRFHDEQCGEVLIGQQKTSGQDSSLLTAVEVMQSKFKVMEIDFNYIRARADNQRTAVSSQLFRLLWRVTF